MDVVEADKILVLHRGHLAERGTHVSPTTCVQCCICSMYKLCNAIFVKLVSILERDLMFVLSWVG